MKSNKNDLDLPLEDRIREELERLVAKYLLVIDDQQKLRLAQDLAESSEFVSAFVRGGS